MKKLLLAGFALAFLLLLPACDGNGSGNDDDDVPGAVATFNATLSGAMSGEISGTAFSGGPGGGSGWGLTLGVAPFKAGGLDGSITFVRETGNRPGEGTYSVLAEPSESDFYAIAIISGGVYNGVSGNLRITSSSSSNVRGTFDFNTSNGSETLRITGGFNATNYTQFPD